MGFQACGAVELVDVEGMLDAVHVRALKLTAAGHDQTVIGQGAASAAAGAIAHAAGRFIDVVCRALHETDIDSVEQRLQGGGQGMHVWLVEARTHMQFSLGGEQGDLDALAAVEVKLADGAECAPQAGKARANDQDLLHGCAPLKFG
ncbi:hypothetical protein D3C75_635430 [compost metagenome]